MLRLESPRLRLGLCILLFFTGAFLLAGSKEKAWGDAGLMHEVARRIATHGSVAIETEWPPMSHVGHDGRIYSQYPLGPSLVAVPFVLVHRALVTAAPSGAPVFLPVTTHLAPALLGGLACVLFFFLARRCGATARAAALGALTLGFATTLFVYARSPFSEILQAACAIGFVGAIDRTLRSPTRSSALVLGLWAGALLQSKTVFALSVACAGAFIAFSLRRDRQALGRVAGWSTLALAPFAILTLAYNAARWGSPFDTGYGETLSLARESIAVGLWGMFLSPGKSVFLYSPPLLLAAFALPRFVREHRDLAVAIAVVVVPPVLFTARLLPWAGDYAWGPRYLVFAIPLLWLPAVVSLGNVPRFIKGSVVAAGLAVQLLGASFYWDHWIRIAIRAHEDWLGKPNRAGAAPPLNAAGLCDACFEDMHGHQWLPVFSPIAGHLWLLLHRGDSWAVAQRDAPWRRYTTVETPSVETYYAATRLDWWGNLWLRAEEPRLFRAGIWLGVLFVGMTAYGARGWQRRLEDE